MPPLYGLPKMKSEMTNIKRIVIIPSLTALQVPFVCVGSEAEESRRAAVRWTKLEFSCVTALCRTPITITILYNVSYNYSV